LLVIAAMWAQPAFADKAPISSRIGLSAGAEIGSTVHLVDNPGRRSDALTVGLDLETFVSDRYLLGVFAQLAGGPFTYAAARGSAHAGIQAPITAVSAIGWVGVGFEQISSICSMCSSVGMPFAELRGDFGYAGKYVEVGLWSNLIVDLGRERRSGLYEYDIGGFTVGVGLMIAYVRR
jgi:hypothetical protein